MFEVRFHGRGGQGAVVASEILALAVFREGKSPQSFPSFGLERRGAPVAAYLRVDDRKITLRQNIYHPDFIVVMDESLLYLEPTTAGLKTGGMILINTPKDPLSFQAFDSVTVGTVAADDIARKHSLGTKFLPIINTAILGAIVKMTGIIPLDVLVSCIEESIEKKRGENAAAAREAYEAVIIKRTP